MSNKVKEISEEATASEVVRSWGKSVIVRCVLDENTSEFRDEVSEIFEMVTKVRVMFDNAAREQGNETIRKQRSDTGKVTSALSDEEKAAKALAKAEALIG